MLTSGHTVVILSSFVWCRISGFLAGQPVLNFHDPQGNCSEMAVATPQRLNALDAALTELLRMRETVD
jgi:hypothetical protein